jgi:DNA adenine methylase
MILKPPTNYAGSKDKLMPQLLKYFPENVDTFYDVFCGGLSVSINSPYKKIISNDIITPLIQFYQSLYSMSMNNYEDKEIEIIKSFKIDKTSKEEFLKVREEFNQDGDPYKFFALVSSCTNNMMRFNKSFKFNQSFGERTINDNTIQKLKHSNLITDLTKDNTWAFPTYPENKQMLMHSSICSQFVSTAFCKIAVELFMKVEKLGSTTEFGRQIINSYAV